MKLPGLVSLGSPKANPYITTQLNIQREHYAISTVAERKNVFPALATDGYRPFADPQDTHDHSEQAAVITNVLNCRDQFSIFRGVAGAGKTSTLQEMCKGLRAGGIEKIHLVAPTNSAVDVLRSEGFGSAQTVAMFLLNRKSLPPDGSFLIIDESGLNSLREGVEMMKIAVEKKYRVLFVGDVRQHKSVETGDFLRILESYSGINKSELTSIHRQQTAEYRHGIELAAAGKYEAAFHQLDDHGFVFEDKGKYLEEAAESFYR